MSREKHRRRAQGAGDADMSMNDDEIHRAGGHRHPRLQQIVHEELAALLRDEVSDPALDGVMFTAVELSVDYKHARVRFASDTGARARAERALTRATPFFRSRLAEALGLKVVPALRFTFDVDAMQYGDDP